MNLAALKRTLTPGTVLEVTAHRHPELIGRRTIVSANTVGFKLSLPDGHPRKDATPGGSHVDWPKAANVRASETDNTLTFAAPEWGSDLMTFRVLEAAPGVRVTRKVTCAECGRTFDLLDTTQADEWFNGHDCEV